MLGINFVKKKHIRRKRTRRSYLMPVSLGLLLMMGAFGLWQANFFVSSPKETEPQEAVVEETVSLPESQEVAVKGTYVELPSPPPIITTATAYEPPVMKNMPPPPSMEKMKKKGCIADGILSEYGGDPKAAIKMINRSECEYLHRSIETWLEAPNFEKVKKYKDQITKPNMIYGMFIAEAIDRSDDLYYPAEQRKFEFDKMCKESSKNKWGEHTCVPDFESKEYRKYLRYITEQAMDIGVQSFMFGQVHYQEKNDLSQAIAPEIIKEMKEYASFLGMEIVVGAQTNDIMDEKYLRNFDYIEGGVGVDGEGNVENGACFSRWWKEPGDWCWALLWHKQYASKANNVLLHLDWSGRQGDDMATFALMDEKTRAKTLQTLHKKFTSQGHGFLLPMLAVLPPDHSGCYGAKKGFYMADKKFSCQDEDVINSLMKEKKKKK